MQSLCRLPTDCVVRTCTRVSPPVRFINPTLYKAGSGTFGFDVSEGNNKAQFCKAGFQAQSGYDCVTGISTPDFELLSQVLGAK